jgi:hypothetical protein
MGRDGSPPMGVAGGTWTGAVQGAGSIAVGIRFVLDEASGSLSGMTYVEDPETHEFLKDADLTGSRNGLSASWTTSTGLLITGTFSADSFNGTLQYPADDDAGPLTSTLTLNR